MNCKVSISVDELRVGPGLSDPPTIHDYDLVTLRQESYVVCHKEPCLGGLEGGREGKGREILYYTSIKVAVSCSFQQVCILCFIIQRGQQDHSRSSAVVEWKFQCVSLSVVVLLVARHILQGVSLYLTMYIYGSYDLLCHPYLVSFYFFFSQDFCLHLFFASHERDMSMIIITRGVHD